MEETKKEFKESYGALWPSISKAGNKYYTGTINGVKVVGFVNEKRTEENKQPEIRIEKQKDKQSD